MYQGYLAKLGVYNVPLSLLAPKSYHAVPNIQDLDPFRNADGVLFRNSLPHIPITMEFSTMEDLTDLELNQILQGLRMNYTNVQERKLSVTCFVPEWGEYVTQDMYLAQPDITISEIDADYGRIKYDSVKFQFVGY